MTDCVGVCIYLFLASLSAQVAIFFSCASGIELNRPAILFLDNSSCSFCETASGCWAADCELALVSGLFIPW